MPYRQFTISFSQMNLFGGSMPLRYSTQKALAARFAMLILLALSISGCATIIEDQKRALLDRKCQERVVRMLNAVSPIIAESNAPQKFCGCFTQKLNS